MEKTLHLFKEQFILVFSHLFEPTFILMTLSLTFMVFAVSGRLSNIIEQIIKKLK